MQVLALVPPVDVGESLEAALARVRRCVGGGKGGGEDGAANGGKDNGDDSDSDLVMEDWVTLNLRDPVREGRTEGHRL